MGRGSSLVIIWRVSKPDLQRLVRILTHFSSSHPRICFLFASSLISKSRRRTDRPTHILGWTTFGLWHAPHDNNIHSPSVFGDFERRFHPVRSAWSGQICKVLSARRWKVKNRFEIFPLFPSLLFLHDQRIKRTTELKKSLVFLCVYSFATEPMGGDMDLRLSYCAFVVCSLLDDWSGVDVGKAIEFVQRCRVCDPLFPDSLRLFVISLSSRLDVRRWIWTSARMWSSRSVLSINPLPHHNTPQSHTMGWGMDAQADLLT
jgi:hypothetical protein